jgi:hypothetical protein
MQEQATTASHRGMTRLRPGPYCQPSPRTERIRLGTNIFILPLDHPLDVAEQIATVDGRSSPRRSCRHWPSKRRWDKEAIT